MNDIEFIKNFCKKYYITNYTINDDLSIDVDGNVDIGYTPTKKSINRLDEIPIKFNKVSGYFNCSNNRLTSLENCPKYVGKKFKCDENNLTSLEHSPEFIGGDFDCYWNPLQSLDGLKIPYKNFYCINKKLLVRKHKLKKSINL